MKIKQAKLFRLHSPISKQHHELEQQLNDFTFVPCLPSVLTSMGWVAPIEDDERLFQQIEHHLIFCLQIEEKILPASVVQKHCQEAIKQIEISENRKLRRKERDQLKDDVIHTLLPRAFSRFVSVYCYVDLQTNWLVINTTQPKRIEQILIAMKKTFDLNTQPVTISHFGKHLTSWLRDHQAPPSFLIENACVLQDPKHITRVIRCKNQNLFSRSISDLIQDGCEIKQLLMSWQDRISFVAHDDASFSSFDIKHEEPELLNDSSDSPKMKFLADFILFSSFISPLMAALLDVCGTSSDATTLEPVAM